MVTTVSIPGMHCAACSALIKDISSEFPSIQDIDIDLTTKAVTISHDEQFDLEQWKNEIESIDAKYAVLPL